MYDKNIFRQYQEIIEENTQIIFEETGIVLNVKCPESIYEEILNVFDEEYLTYLETNSGIILEHSLDEIVEILSDYDIFFSLTEAAPVRKMVVRGGRRKIVFRCPPGQKKIKRRCVRRPAAELARVKRGARKAARKAKGKKSRANRRRKISLKRRIGLPKKHHK